VTASQVLPVPFRRLLPLVWLVAALFAGHASASELVLVHAGALPVILTAPHGGRADVPGCETRSTVGSRFVITPDLNTDVLALSIAEELGRLTGKRPYLVVARFHRRFIDANRRADEAYGAPGCKADYDYYHGAIRRFLDEVREKHPRAMLFDIHGQAAYPDSILRGTRYGATVKSLLARAGPAALTGPDSVFGKFALQGYRIVPANDVSPTDKVEAPAYTGGHTVALYGSGNTDGIDAMQIEFGRDFREQRTVEKTARDAAAAIAAFYERYLR
jgi:N-formylglutamate amidohydrolase